MLYLISYDVQDDKIRTKIMKQLKDWGYHLQKSVFVGDCVDREFAQAIYNDVLQKIDTNTDHLFMVPLCNACVARRMMSGKHPQFDEPVWIV